MKDKKEQKPKKNWFKYILFLEILWEFLGLLKKGKKIEKIEDNFKEYLKEEEEEIEDYVEEKEGLLKFLRHSGNIFSEFFIPCHSNGHKPKILRTRSLTLIVIIMALLKISVALYVFYFTAYQAKMSEDMTAQVLDLINRDRAAQKLAPLNMNTVLNSSARSKAENMVANNYFAHYSPDGKKPWDFIDRGAYPYLFVGENLAMNFTSAESAHQALMLSPTHKENIMSDKYRDIGLAVVNGEIAGKNTNVLVQLFAQKLEPQAKLALVHDKSAGSTEPIVPLAPAAPKQAAELSAAKPVVAVAAKTETIKALPKTKPESAPIAEENELLKIAKNLPLLPNISEQETLPVPEEGIIPSMDYAAAPEAVSKFPVAENQVLPEADIASLDNASLAYAKAELSPNINIEENMITRVKSFDNIPDEDVISSDKRMAMINNFMLAVLAALFILLIANIIIKAEIQHKPVIVQTLLAIICLTGLIYLNFNFLENVLPKLFVV